MKSNHQTQREVVIAQLADELRLTLLAARTAVRRAPADPYVVQLRKDVQRGRATPCAMLLTLLAADLADGASFDDVAAFPRQLLSMLECLAEPDPAATGDLHAAIDVALHHETIAEGAANCAELELSRDKSPATLRRARGALLHHRQKLDRAIAPIERAMYAPQVATR